MTVTSDQMTTPPLDKTDQRPGSSDVAWAERAYHHQQREPRHERRSTFRQLGRRWRVLVATLAIVLLTAGLVVAMRVQGAAPSPVVHSPTSSQTTTAPGATTAGSPFGQTPTLLRPFPPLFPTITTPKR
jgi:hypothetical protein